MYANIYFVVFTLLQFCIASFSFAEDSSPAVRIKDLVEVRGVRSNPLTGLGLVVGLQGTGDSKASIATNKAAAMLMSRLGIFVSPADVITKNIAIVALTADLPPFARIGDNIDIRVSSIGDASNLEGGTLLLATLSAVDEQVYATVQGSITQGTAMAGADGGTGQGSRGQSPKTVSLSKAGVIEKEFLTTFINNNYIELSIKNADFTTSSRIAKALNDFFGEFLANPINAGLVTVKVPVNVARNNPSFNPVTFMSVLEQIRIIPDNLAIVVINERTGTIVSGENVVISAVAISHGRLEIKIGKKNNKVAEVSAMTTVGDLVNALNTLGAGPKDVVSILQTLENAKALRAKLKIM